jgi:predicted nucleotidyltransferase
MVPNMGSFDRKTFSISDALFTKTQQQLLRLLFGQPEKSFYSKEIVDKAGIGTGTVLRELEKLSTAGLVTVKKIGNQKHYQANPSSPVFDELKGIVRKTFGLADPLHLVLEQFKNKIKVAFIYGSVAKGSDTAESDIDLMLISDQLTYPDLLVSFSELETQLGRQLNPTIYTVEEFRSKMIAENSFVARVIEQPKIFLIGSKDDLPPV